MRIKKERKPVRVTCIDCGCLFTAKSKATLRCPECNLKQRKKDRQRYAEGFKSVRVVRKKTSKPKSMTQVLRELEAYNKEHGTYLTYGQFMVLIDKGEA